MPFLFDFGVSQEDPLTEQRVLEIQPGDRILSVASGGEVPFGLLSLIENICLSAVDISDSQIKLCRLKLLAARHVPFPENGYFLGYAPMGKTKRAELFAKNIRPHLSPEDVAFWDENIAFLKNGIIGAGRFEQYIRKMRMVAGIFIGKRNLQHLIACENIEEQAAVFEKHIAKRKSLQWLFKIAFHPAIYKKRGLREQALQHAGENTGERFYGKFKDFCTGNLAAANYFLQYFLTGKCAAPAAFPEFLQPSGQINLQANLPSLELKISSIEQAVKEQKTGFFNKIHLSNVGDWMSESQYFELMELIRKYGEPGAKICIRFLQKNHFLSGPPPGFSLDLAFAKKVEKKDRFPFYTIQALTLI